MVCTIQVVNMLVLLKLNTMQAIKFAEECTVWILWNMPFFLTSVEGIIESGAFAKLCFLSPQCFSLSTKSCAISQLGYFLPYAYGNKYNSHHDYSSWSCQQLDSNNLYLIPDAVRGRYCTIRYSWNIMPVWNYFLFLADLPCKHDTIQLLCARPLLDTYMMS